MSFDTFGQFLFLVIHDINPQSLLKLYVFWFKQKQTIIYFLIFCIIFPATFLVRGEGLEGMNISLFLYIRIPF